MLAEDALKAALSDYRLKQQKANAEQETKEAAKWIADTFNKVVGNNIDKIYKESYIYNNHRQRKCQL